MLPGYGYHLNDSVRNAVKLHPEGITSGKLAQHLNGFLQLNYPKDSREFNLLRNRILRACQGLETLGMVKLTKHKTEVNTEYYNITPTEKC